MQMQHIHSQEEVLMPAGIRRTLNSNRRRAGVSQPQCHVCVELLYKTVARRHSLSLSWLLYC